MNESDIKACPRCGTPPMSTQGKKMINGEWSVLPMIRCRPCGLIRTGESNEQAIWKWNMLATCDELKNAQAWTKTLACPPQETCAECGYMRSLTAPCKCGEYLKLSPRDLLNEMKAASDRWYGVCRSWHALTGPEKEQKRDALYRIVRAMNAEIESLECDVAESANNQALPRLPEAGAERKGKHE